MNREQRDHVEWENPRNWRGGWLGIYHSARDSRLWVPKRRPGFGWTINTARPAGMALLAGLPVLAVVLTWLLRRRN